MAKHGHTATVIVSTPSLQTSVDSWSGIGFTSTGTEDGFTWLTDGQLLLGLSEQEFPSPGIAYFGSSQDDVGIAPSSPDNQVLLHHYFRASDQAQRPSKEQNPLLGYLDAVVVGVPDALAARVWAENNGFFVLEEFGSPQPQADVTDGLITLSFRAGYAGRFLCYSTVIDEDLANDISEVLEATGSIAVADTLRVFRNADDRIDMIRFSMPDSTVVVVMQDL